MQIETKFHIFQSNSFHGNTKDHSAFKSFQCSSSMVYNSVVVGPKSSHQPVHYWLAGKTTLEGFHTINQLTPVPCIDQQ